MKQTAAPASGIPDHLRSLFWEYPPDALDWEDDRDLIVRRVLAAGNWDAITWLRATLGDAGLRAWILKHEGRGLSPRQLRFWELLLDLPADRADAWIAARRHTIWEGRTAP